MFQFRRFPSYTYLFSIWWQVINLPDCSIRKSADRHVFAISRSLSQLITSFFGSQCQGIRPAPFFTWPFFAFWIPLSSRIILSLVLVFQLRLLVVFYPNFFVLKTLLRFVLPLLSRLIQFSRFYFEAASLLFDAGGLKWVRTIDLALIRRAL